MQSATEQTGNVAGTSIIVCGLGRFGLRVVECLHEQSPLTQITVVTDSATRADRLSRVQKLGVRIIPGDFRFPDIRERADVVNSSAILLCIANDSDSLEMALDVRGEAPHVRIIMRMDEGRIAERLMRDFGINLVLSPPALAANRFSHAALLPLPEPSGDRLASSFSNASENQGATLERVIRLPHRYNTSRPLLSIAALLVMLFASGVAIFKTALNIEFVDAIYFTATIVTTVGFGDYNLMHSPPWIKLFGTVLMFGGVVLVALLTSFITNFYLSGAATRMRAERLAERAHNHVIVCGLGTVGLEIVRDLIQQQIPVIVIDNAPDSAAARMVEGRIAIIFGDAASEEALLRAGVQRARALIACLSDDAKNLEIGLTAQTLAQEQNPPHALRLVLRCFDSELARRIHAVSNDYTLLSSAEIAAPIFARAALDTDANTNIPELPRDFVTR